MRRRRARALWPVKIGEARTADRTSRRGPEWVAVGLKSETGKLQRAAIETHPQHEFEGEYPSAAATQALAERSTAQQRRGAVARPSRSRGGRRRS
jgi:hypothetical protein